jgi:hypothetical protein
MQNLAKIQLSKKKNGYRVKTVRIYDFIRKSEQRKMRFSNSRKTTITNFSAKINYTGVKRIR